MPAATVPAATVPTATVPAAAVPAAVPSLSPSLKQAIVGFDDVPMAAWEVYQLTTVRQPMRELGATAARFLDELISGSRTEPRHEVLPTELVIRSSSTRPRKETR